MKVFRVASHRRTEYIATNGLSQSDVSAVQKACGVRWKIERFHREAKQLTGVEKCQCRLARIVRNHITCAFLVWIYLMQKSQETGQTFYQAGLTQIEQKKEKLDLKSRYFGILPPYQGTFEPTA